jgi:pimeloyl-ACP methyl ester carboxylesterase
LLLGLLALPPAGCSTTGVTLRSVPKGPLVDQLKLTARGGPRPSARTMQMLRVYNLADDVEGDPRQLLHKLQAIADREPSAEKVYALAELSYLGAKKTEVYDKQMALDLYGAGVLHAYQYLFDERYARSRNPYDPQFRGACDLYNGALEGALRIVCASKELLPAATKTIHTAAGSWDITCVLRGSSWRVEDFGRFEFVSDYEITGLKNHYQTHGLGVPLIAVRRGYAGEPAATRFYPPQLSFPVTAFLRPLPRTVLPDGQGAPRYQGVLELYDPLSTTHVEVTRQHVSLEGDLSTPVAYFLSQPELESLAWVGLLRPERLMALRPDRPEPIMGLYMAQPYEPGKIPVLLVHGLWSSPMTWMEMFNDLRSTAEIRDRYQFWFYLYPTGQPFWLSAAQLRHDLAEARQTLDPQRQEPALDQMVLIGHSMGGLLSKLQTVDSGDAFWKLVSPAPLGALRADADVREKLQYTFFFQPNPSIRRVVTIATPHRGSSVSNLTTQWLLDKLIHLPQRLVNSQQKLFRENQGAFPDRSLLKIETSVDALAPDCPIFPVLLATSHLPAVKYHNIVGLIPDRNWFTSWVAGSDGVVSQESARVAGVDSELIVPADHSAIHSHPAAVLEVRRILLEHLAELQGSPGIRVASAQ